MNAAMEILWIQVSFVISPVTQSLVGGLVWVEVLCCYTRVFGVLVVVVILLR